MSFLPLDLSSFSLTLLLRREFRGSTEQRQSLVHTKVGHAPVKHNLPPASRGHDTHIPCLQRGMVRAAV
jgi:hypothetical protein